MSLSSSDMIVDLGLGISTQITLAISIFIFIYFTTLKVLFNSYSISEILRSYKTKENIKKEYRNLFVTREGLLYHISKATATGYNYNYIYNYNHNWIFRRNWRGSNYVETTSRIR